MNKKIIRLGMMAASLVVLIIVYFATLNMPDEQSGFDEPAQNSVLLIDISDKEIASIEINNTNEFVFKNTGGKWSLAGHNNFRLSNIALNNIGGALTSLQSRDIIEGGNIADFGLSEPLATVRVNFSDGSSQSIYAGKQTVDGKFYYAMAEGGGDVYTIEKAAGDTFFYGYNEILSKSVTQVAVTSVDELEFRLQGKEYSFKLGLPYGVEYLSWGREDYIEQNSGGVLRLDNAYAFNNIYSWVSDIRLAGIVMDDTSDIESYGFDEKCIMLKLFDGEDTIHFYLGNDAGDGLRYIMFEGDEYIYTAKAEYFEILNTVDIASAFDRRLSDVVPRQAESVSLIGAEYAKTLKPTENEDDKRAYNIIFELGWDSFIEPWSVEGKEPVWTIATDGLVLSDEVNLAQLNNNDGSYIKQRDGSLAFSLTYDFYDFSNLFYAVSFNGEDAQKVIMKDKIDNAMAAVK